MKTWTSWCVAGAIALLAMPGYAGSDYGLKVKDKEPPESIAPELREALVPKVYILTNPDETMFEFWFAETIEVSEMGEDNTKTLGNLKPMTLLGAAVVHGEKDMEMTDFRDDPIDPGVYTFRHALQPQDGNHMGTAPLNSGFGVLIPVDKDGGIEGFYGHDDMIELASEDTIAFHPPILNIQAMESAEGEFPRLEANEEEDWKFLVMQLPISTGDKDAQLPIKLVYEGMGEL